MMCDTDTREELDETLKESNDAIMNTVDELCPLPIHNRLTLVNNTDEVVRLEDLKKINIGQLIRAYITKDIIIKCTHEYWIKGKLDWSCASCGLDRWEFINNE